MTRLLPVAALAALLAGCAPATRVVLLPQDGVQGAVEVRTKSGSTQLNKAYTAAEVHTHRATQTEQLDAKSVNERYREVLAVQPPPAQRFTLYFEPGGAHLTTASAQALAEVLSRASERPGGEILVTGHTDSVGTTESNDALSLQRAQAIREMFIARGFDAARVEASGRGERELLVHTADNVDESQNRRAEIVVR